MKLKFLSLAILLNMLCFAVPSEAVFYGICCPAECPEGQEAKETETDNCKCVCNVGETVPTAAGEAVCCQGATNVSTGEIDQTCCENAGGSFVAEGGQGLPAACCKQGSSKDIEGSLHPTCCNAAGGRINNGKCCRQAPQGS